MNQRSLKPKHIEALVELWLKDNIATGTIKNRMSAIRWWARKVNKQNVVARSNDHYGIPNRIFVTNESKAKSVIEADSMVTRLNQNQTILKGHVKGKFSEKFNIP